MTERRPRWLPLLVLFAVCHAPVERLSAQIEEKKIVPKMGTQFFQGLLGKFGLQPLPTVRDLKKVSPEETVVIVFGDNDVLDEISQATSGLNTFLENGGALLVATDESTGDRLDELGIRINGTTVRERAGSAFLEQPNTPMIREFTNRQHPLSFGVIRGVAANMPSYIISNGDYRNIAVFSPNCYTEIRGFRRWQWQRRLELAGAPYTVGSPWDAPPGGRVIVMAGHKAFTNLMMHFVDDNDNIQFAKNCVRWLSESPLKPGLVVRKRSRKHVLFVDNGRVVTKLDGPIAFPPIPAIELINSLLHRLEEENFFNRLLHGNVSPYRLWQLIIIVTTFFLLFWGVRRAIKARFFVEREATRLAEGLAGYPVNTHNEQWDTASTAGQKHRTQYHQGNYWDTLHHLARHFFREFVGVDNFKESSLPLIVQGTKKQRGQIESLWELAIGGEPRPISARELRKTIKQMDTLAQQIMDGDLGIEHS